MAKNAKGRPTKYTKKIGDQICELISTSNVGLEHLCKTAGYPNPATVYRWIIKHKEFRENYTRARETQAEVLADEIIEIADTPLIGKKTVRKKTGKEAATIETYVGDQVERSKLMVDARKWKASKLAPKKYGDKLDVDHTTGGQVISVTLTRKPNK